MTRELQYLRTHLRNRGFKGLFGFNRIVRQVGSIGAALRLSPPDATIRYELQWLSSDLNSLLEEPELPLAVNVLSQCFKILDSDQKTALEERHARMQTFAKSLQDANRQLAQRQVKSKSIPNWFAQTANTCGMAPGYAHACLRATPEFWKRVLEAIDPIAFQDAQARLAYSQAVVELQKRNYDNAQRYLDHALSCNSCYVPAFEAYGYLCARREQPEKSIEWYRRAVEGGTSDPMTFNNLAWYLSTGETLTARDEYLAVSAARRAVELSPCASFWDTLAHVLIRTGNAFGAIVPARAALMENPEKPEYQDRMREIRGAIDEAARVQREVDRAIESAARARREAEEQTAREEEKRQKKAEKRARQKAIDKKRREVEEQARREMKQQAPQSGEQDEDEASTGQRGGQGGLGNDLSQDEDDGHLSLGDEDDDDLCLSAGSSDLTLAAGDSGLSLDDEPLDLDGSSVEQLELPEDEDEGVISLGPDEEFLLTPVYDDDDDQVTALEDDAVYTDDTSTSLLGAPSFRQPSGPLAQLSGKAYDRGSYTSGDAVPQDDVDCTVFAPPRLAQDDQFLVQVFAHLPQHGALAALEAKEFDEDTVRRGKSSLGTRIAQGSRLTFELRMPSIEIEEAVAQLTWRGEPNSVQFEAHVPKGAKVGSCTGALFVSQDSIPIGQIKFKVKIVAGEAGQPSANEPVGAAQRFQRAFVSYSSEDRNEVLRRVQVLSAAGIEIYQDLLSLETGKRWQEALYRFIEESDVMFLFWSSSARKSPEVEKEWRYAMQVKGEDFICPIIIEGPPIPMPPPELAHLHFNDKLLYFMGEK